MIAFDEQVHLCTRDEANAEDRLVKDPNSRPFGNASNRCHSSSGKLS
jgi:hypothetical protein